MLPLVTFLAATAWWPGFTEPANTARWIVLSVFLPVLFHVERDLSPLDAALSCDPRCAVRLGFLRRAPHRGSKKTAAAGLLAGWIGYATLSLFWTPALPDGLNALWHLVLLALAGAIGARTADLTPAFIGFGLGIAVNSAVVLAQLGGLAWFEQFAAPAGLAVNKNMLAEMAVLAVVGLWAAGAWTVALLCLPSLLLTTSKTVAVALILTACAWAAYRRRPWLALGLALVVVDGVLLWHSAWPVPTLTQRFGLWRDTLAGATWSGHGLGSFDAVWPLLRDTAPDALTGFNRRPGHPHADWMLLLSDLGVGAAFAFGLAALVLAPLNVAHVHGNPSRTTHSGAKTGQLVVAAFLAVGLAAFPLDNPACLLMAGLAGGHVLGQSA